MSGTTLHRPPARSCPLPALLVLLLGLGAVPADLWGDEVPTLVRQEGRLELTALPDVLSTPEVREQLTSGLTTTFLFRLTARDTARHRAAAEGWIAVRYDLWDEIFQTAAGGFFGDRRERLGSFGDLVAWWRSPETVLPLLEGLAAGPWQVEIEVDLIPFSRSEQRDTQRWLADSLGAGRGGGAAESVAESAEEGPDPATNVFNLLLATSIRRDSLIRWSWTVEVGSPPREGAP